MKTTLTLIFYSSVCLFFNLGKSYGQCNGFPCFSALGQPDPMTTCITADPNGLTCYTGSTTSDPSLVFPAWCGNNVNTQWLAFTAVAPTTFFAIVNYSCSQGNALQAALFSSSDCVNFSIVSNCVNNVPVGQSGGVTANNLVPGQVYYLCIGGSNGAICDFGINPPGWGGYAENCVLDDLGLPYWTYDNVTDAVWSVDPPTAAIFNPPVGPETDITWLEPGIITLCVNSSHCPEYCQTVNISGGVFEEYVNLCEGHTVQCAGNTYSAPGIYSIEEPDGPFCVKTTHCNVHLVPTTHTTETVYFCQYTSATCAGEEFFDPGTYPVMLTGYLGCDSIVTCKINVFPPSPPTNLLINLCGPSEYQVCNTIFNSSGTYTEVCTNWLGCDSTVNLNLAILEPEAVIDPPGVLNCSSDTITLDGSHSSLNTALGGTTNYKWTGPGIIGSNNMPTVQVNQPGIYCLILEHARGLICRDTACVVIMQTSAVPGLPQISGNLNPCADSTYIYTATSNGNPAPTSFTWTLPGNQSFTTLSLNSIQVSWDTVVTGNICVTANNACGASQPACQSVVVQTPVQQPVISGPASVCAGGGNYTFTLDVEQPGVTYNWTIPTGAVLTGSGDTVNINFQNATSGQVCVTPQNACGSGVPVCRSVQVNPVPTADLSSDAQICAGDSVDLHFALNGNGPFDVSWSIGNQNFTLNDILNGHVERVSPTQTNVYKVTGISDNSATACTAVLSDSVTVTVWQPANTVLNAQICSGDGLIVGGAVQTVSGIYSDTLSTVHGCDSVIVTTLTVNVIDTTIINSNTCDPAQAGTQTQVLNQLNGCDSLVITITTLQPSDTTLIFDNSCDINNVGVFTQNLSNVYGCDSLIVTTVTFSLSDTTLVSATTCDPAGAGIFNNNLLTVDGCDSLIITTVTLVPTSTNNLTGATCNPADVGVFTNVLTNQFGCDSTVITTISFVPLATTFLTSTTCDPAAAGVFTDHITTAGGCDSVVVTTVTLLPSSTSNLTATTCDPVSAGVLTTVLTNQFGCDSTVITTVTLLPTSTTNLSATTCNPASVGVFSNTLTNQFGCDSTVITTVTLAPLPTTFLTATTCDPASTGVFTNHITTTGGCDSIIVTTVSLLPSSTTNLTGTSCNPAQVGVFTDVLINQFGCDSTVITTVTLVPLPTTFLSATTCDPASTGVFTDHIPTAGGCDSVVVTNVNLLPSSQTTVNLTTCDPAQVGSTSIGVPNQFGCDSTIVTITTLLPANNCSVAASLNGSDIPCGSNSGTLTLTPTIGIAPFSYTVLQGATTITSGTINSLGSAQVIANLPAGNYTVNITSPNGFSTTAQAAIVQLVPPVLTSQANSSYTGFDVSCSGESDGSAIAAATGGTSPYTYSWSIGGNSQQVNNLSAGIYTVTVTDAKGCTNVSTLALTEPDPLELGFIVNDLDCFGENDGAIKVEVKGGAAPYRYSLNNAPEQSSDIFVDLLSGIYTIAASDANDCQKTDVIVVNAATPLNVDLGDDIAIGLGDTATLHATVNVPLDSILSVVWTPPVDTSECPLCLTQMVIPYISTVYTIQVQALNGCTGQDRVAVTVDSQREIYVPNVFSPNGDGANDMFTIYAKAGSVRKILSLQVFDRWGDAIITLKDFQPNSPTIGWDGTYRGDPMNPGVFVWLAEIEFVDGQRELFKGDVTIVR